MQKGLLPLMVLVVVSFIPLSGMIEVEGMLEYELPYYEAIKKDEVTFFKMLYKYGSYFDPNISLGDDQIPLLALCAVCDKYDIGAFLLSRKNIGVNKGTYTCNMTPLLFACQRGAIDFVEMLLNHPDIDPNKKSLDGKFPLSVVTGLDADEDIVDLLLKHPKINPNEAYSGWTPLLNASFYGHIKIVEKLLGHKGIDVYVAESDTGKTALGIARQKGHTKIVDLLKEYIKTHPKKEEK